MHFRQLRKELAEIVEIVRTYCGQQLTRRGWRHHRPRLPRRGRLDYEQMLATPVREARFVVLDTETTGFEPYGGDEIVQIALVEYHGLEPTGRELCTRVRPGIPIPPRSTAIHGIDDAAVADAPSIDEIIERIVAFIDAGILVGHHVAFDLRFLDRVTRRCLLADIPNPRMDTVMLYLATVGDSEDIGLDEVAAACGVSIEGRHDALGDARACGRILAHLAGQLATAGMTVGELLERVHPVTGLPIHHPAEASAATVERDTDRARHP